MKLKFLVFCSVILLNGCANNPDPFHSFTDQLGLTNNNNYVPQAQVNFALPNDWQTDVVHVKSVGVKQTPAPQNQYSEDSKNNNSNNPILSNGLNNN